MNNVASPGHVVHHLLTEHGLEQLQAATDLEVDDTAVTVHGGPPPGFAGRFGPVECVVATRGGVP
jgi:hypothetical protein